jgi:hypothetical protein
MADSIEVGEFRAAKSVTTREVKALTARVWADVKEQDAFKAKYPALAASPSPYSFTRKANQFGVAETIAIAVVGGLLQEAAVAVWKEFIWPALKRRFGKDVDEQA